MSKLGVPEVIEVDGIKFRCYPNAPTSNLRKYYRCQSKLYKKGIRYLHIYLWEKHYKQKVPKGYHIHHEDGDSHNNSIENLECKKQFKHLSDHFKEWHRQNKEKVSQHLQNINHLSKEWHGSPDGKKWHSEHGKKSFRGRKFETCFCIECGKSYKTKQPKKSKFCHPNCKARHRRRVQREANRL